MTKHSIKSVNIMKIWKIFNKKHKILFDNNYEYLIDANGKFGDEKKYYDFYFLHVDYSNYTDIVKYLLNSEEEVYNI